MKQLLQRFDTGEVRLAQVPIPAVSGVQLLVEARASAISPGTERSLLDFGRAGLVEKARRRPDQVLQVIEKARTDGIASAVDAVRARLSDPTTLGYCSAGVVIETGPRVRGFAAGDRVVTNGAHGEYVRVPHTLAARIPDTVDFESAAFTPLASIALQGIRLAAPALGETVVVYGLGLIGLLAVQLLRSNGCRVLGIDRDAGRLALAARFGAIAVDPAAGDVAARVLAETRGLGADAVLLTLAGDSDEPVHHAAGMSRQRGRLVLVGVTGLSLRRDDFYKKELSFTVSCSYGPGRYDPNYEDEGNDYPAGFVRWTEQRNFEAVLELMASGALDVRALITHRFPFERADEAYALIQGTQPSLGVILQYPDRGGQPPTAEQRTIGLARVRRTGDRARATRHGVAAVVGAGNFAQRTVLPELRAAGFQLHTVISQTGTSATVAAEKFGFATASTDVERVLADPAIDTVFVLTRHASHAALALRALEAGKDVFVEKPLALVQDDLDALERAVRASDRLLTVGFNRRFSPFTRALREAVDRRANPLALLLTINAGALAASHWTRDAAQGGRIIGEACHFIDLARAIVGAPIARGTSAPAPGPDGRGGDGGAHITLGFADGSTAAIHYLTSGSKAYPKERVEAFVDGRVYVIDNWRRLRRFGGRPALPAALRRQDKGHGAELAAWYRALEQRQPPIPLDELFEVSAWTLQLSDATRPAEASLSEPRA